MPGTGPGWWGQAWWPFEHGRLTEPLCTRRPWLPAPPADSGSEWPPWMVISVGRTLVLAPSVPHVAGVPGGHAAPHSTGSSGSTGLCSDTHSYSSGSQDGTAHSPEAAGHAPPPTRDPERLSETRGLSQRAASGPARPAEAVWAWLGGKVPRHRRTVPPHSPTPARPPHPRGQRAHGCLFAHRAGPPPYLVMRFIGF